MAALPLQDEISQSSSVKREYRVLVAEFGDGYSQRTSDGTNTTRDEWNITWGNLDETKRDTVVTALDLKGGFDTHSWQAPGDASSKEWRVLDGYTLSTSGGDIFTISITMRQEFE